MLGHGEMVYLNEQTTKCDEMRGGPAKTPQSQNIPTGFPIPQREQHLNGPNNSTRNSAALAHRHAVYLTPTWLDVLRGGVADTRARAICKTVRFWKTWHSQNASNNVHVPDSLSICGPFSSFFFLFLLFFSLSTSGKAIRESGSSYMLWQTLRPSEPTPSHDQLNNIQYPERCLLCSPTSYPYPPSFQDSEIFEFYKSFCTPTSF